MIQGLGAIHGTSPLSRDWQGFGQTAMPSAGTQLETSFTQALQAATSRAVGNIQGAEALSIDALQGNEMNVREVVDAVMTAEQTLQAAISIRDKIVQAYLEVSRMQI